MTNSKLNGFNDDIAVEKLKHELSEQKTRFCTQLEDSIKNVTNLQAKVSEMQTKIEQMENELSLKAWNVERLQGELDAAVKDDEYVRKKLKLLEEEKTTLRHQYSENEDEFRKKYETLEKEYNELEEKYISTQCVANNLEMQIEFARKEAQEWREDVEKIRTDLEEQTRILKNALENSEAERKICQDKWQKEFEILRTQNLDREETLMTDCEWQLRQLKKQCKDKIEKSELSRKEALERAEILENELAEKKQEVESLKVYQAELKSLRGVVTEQEYSIQSLVEQIDYLKSDLQTANESLIEQMAAVKKIKYQCDNALYDKDRQMMYRIDEVRNEAAAFWEEKLYTEMTRLKNELESVYVDERREALNKLQSEHIEELRAVTTRFTANEEELRLELMELQEGLDRKSAEFLDLREKSDNALLQTRMHLDRADREYQNAMCREEERREALEESLRKVFEAEKAEMEEKFRDRLDQVKEEFAKELQLNISEMTEKHKSEIEIQKMKLQIEKEEALQELAERHRKKLADAEEQMREIEVRHQRDLKDLKVAYDAEKAALDKRDISNANEIEQLHRRCRCLTNLFEEMRMRYERREPRQEDLREIDELRGRCESQERDLYTLTDRLREMQIQMAELQQNCVNSNSNNNSSTKKGVKNIKKPPPKTIPTNCDVIYEENEERESPPPPSPQPPSSNSLKQQPTNDGDADDSNESNDEDDEENTENDIAADDDQDNKETVTLTSTDLKKNPKNLKKDFNTINEDDDAHMISTV